MKPQEILAMLEEASGTRMYEEKKERVLKTLDRKESKLREIDEVSCRWPKSGTLPILNATSLLISTLQHKFCRMFALCIDFMTKP